VLTNSMVLIGNELSNGDAHLLTNMPCILAGNAGGAIQTGRHLRFADHPRLTRLQLTMLQLMGVNVAQFADATAPLSLA
jgi:hypothetical protein